MRTLGPLQPFSLRLFITRLALLTACRVTGKSSFVALTLIFVGCWQSGTSKSRLISFKSA